MSSSDSRITTSLLVVPGLVVTALIVGVALAVTGGDDSDDAAATALDEDQPVVVPQDVLPTPPPVTTEGEHQEPGRRCYEFADYAIFRLQMTIEVDQGVVGEGRASTDGGRTFDQRQQFEGQIVRGTTANLDVTTSIGDEKQESKQSWTFVDRGLRLGTRVYDQVDCSTFESTFVDASEALRCEPTITETEPSLGYEARAESSDDVEVWALFFPTWPMPAGEVVRIPVNEQVKIVWRAPGEGEFLIDANGPDSERLAPDWGPDLHSGSNWNRPGDEWGTGWTFPRTGCWEFQIRRDGWTASLVAEVYA